MRGKNSLIALHALANASLEKTLKGIQTIRGGLAKLEEKRKLAFKEALTVCRWQRCAEGTNIAQPSRDMPQEAASFFSPQSLPDLLYSRAIVKNKLAQIKSSQEDMLKSKEALKKNTEIALKSKARVEELGKEIKRIRGRERVKGEEIVREEWSTLKVALDREQLQEDGVRQVKAKAPFAEGLKYNDPPSHAAPSLKASHGSCKLESKKSAINVTGQESENQRMSSTTNDREISGNVYEPINSSSLKDNDHAYGIIHKEMICESRYVEAGAGERLRFVVDKHQIASCEEIAGTIYTGFDNNNNSQPDTYADQFDWQTLAKKVKNAEVWEGDDSKGIQMRYQLGNGREVSITIARESKGSKRATVLIDTMGMGSSILGRSIRDAIRQMFSNSNIGLKGVIVR